MNYSPVNNARAAMSENGLQHEECVIAGFTGCPSAPGLLAAVDGTMRHFR